MLTIPTKKQYIKNRTKYLEYQKEWSKRNREQKLKYQKQYRKRNKLKWRKILEDELKLTCEICGEARMWCLDFHHENPKEKEFHIAKYIGAYAPSEENIEMVMSEINKYMVVCSNCHRDIHYGEVA